MKPCHYCGKSREQLLAEGKRDPLRPYGPGGSWVCFGCATATPEREAAADATFGVLLQANSLISPTGVVAIGEADGPRPFDLPPAE